MGRHLAIKNYIGTHMAMKTRCCMLRRAKNTSTRSFVYISTLITRKCRKNMKNS